MTVPERMAEVLGGSAVLGRGVGSGGDLVGRARSGLPYGSIGALSRRFRLGQAEVSRVLGIPDRTMARRKSAGFFDAGESDRILRVARVGARAEDVLGDADRASTWLHRPNRALGGEAPLGLMDTDLGCRMVEDVLGRLEHGVAG